VIKETLLLVTAILLLVGAKKCS